VLGPKSYRAPIFGILMRFQVAAILPFSYKNTFSAGRQPERTGAVLRCCNRTIYVRLSETKVVAQPGVVSRVIAIDGIQKATKWCQREHGTQSGFAGETDDHDQSPGPGTLTALRS